MSGVQQPGEKVGEGATAEVFAFGAGRVVKLARPGVERRATEYEAAQSLAVYESGAPCPATFGMVEIEGRLGIVYERLIGEPLLQRFVRGELTAVENGQAMAEEQWRLHSGKYQAAVTSFEGWLRFNLGRLDGSAPPDVLDRVRATAEALPQGTILCHGDLHADNIFVTDSGTVPIDWTSALMAHPLVDVGRQHLSLTVLPIEDERPVARWFDEMRPVIQRAFIARYAELSGESAADLEAAVVPFTVVMAALRIAEPVCSALETDVLVEYVREHAARS